jgi:hypothetical protein
VVLSIFILTKFVHGAWIVVIVIPLLVLLFWAIHRHYTDVERQLTPAVIAPLVCPHNTVVILIEWVHRGVMQALEYAQCLSKYVHAVHVEIDPAETAQVERDWEQLRTEVLLTVVPSPYHIQVLLTYIQEVDTRRGDDRLTVLVPEFVPKWWWQQLLHNQPVFLLKAALLYRPGIVVTSVSYYLR